jgi:hypothetical protein
MLTRAGVKTNLDVAENTEIPYIEGCARIPGDFNTVADVLFTDGQIEVVSENGGKIRIPVDWEFLDIKDH